MSEEWKRKAFDTVTQINLCAREHTAELPFNQRVSFMERVIAVLPSELEGVLAEWRQYRGKVVDFKNALTSSCFLTKVLDFWNRRILSQQKTVWLCVTES